MKKLIGMVGTVLLLTAAIAQGAVVYSYQMVGSEGAQVETSAVLPDMIYSKTLSVNNAVTLAENGSVDRDSINVATLVQVKPAMNLHIIGGYNYLENAAKKVKTNETCKYVTTGYSSTGKSMELQDEIQINTESLTHGIIASGYGRAIVGLATDKLRTVQNVRGQFDVRAISHWIDTPAVPDIAIERVDNGIEHLCPWADYIVSYPIFTANSEDNNGEIG